MRLGSYREALRVKREAWRNSSNPKQQQHSGAQPTSFVDAHLFFDSVLGDGLASCFGARLRGAKTIVGQDVRPHGAGGSRVANDRTHALTFRKVADVELRRRGDGASDRQSLVDEHRDVDVGRRLHGVRPNFDVRPVRTRSAGGRRAHPKQPHA